MLACSCAWLIGRETSWRPSSKLHWFRVTCVVKIGANITPRHSTVAGLEPVWPWQSSITNVCYIPGPSPSGKPVTWLAGFSVLRFLCFCLVPVQAVPRSGPESGPKGCAHADHSRWPHHPLPRSCCQGQWHCAGWHCLRKDQGLHQVWLWLVLSVVRLWWSFQ